MPDRVKRDILVCFYLLLLLIFFIEKTKFINMLLQIRAEFAEVDLFEPLEDTLLELMRTPHLTTFLKREGLWSDDAP